jgi:hypothetical protein
MANSKPMILVKVCFGGYCQPPKEIRRLRVLDLKDLLVQVKRIDEQYNNNNVDQAQERVEHALIYLDGDSDQITVRSEEDFQTALEHSPYETRAPKFWWLPRQLPTKSPQAESSANAEKYASYPNYTDLAQITTFDDRAEALIFALGKTVHLELPGCAAGQTFIVNWKQDRRWNELITHAITRMARNDVS